MHNIATIYRFNTPFLDLGQEKDNLLYVIKKVEKSIEFDGVKFEKQVLQEGNYYKVKLKLEDGLGLISFYYISDIAKNIYHLPIFKLDVSLNSKFLLNNSAKKKAVKFLNNIFECFDGLNEREFLIDLNNNFYYKSGFFGTKHFPNYDFSDIKKIRKEFEGEKGMILVEDFIQKFSKGTFELSYEKSKYYHKLYSIFLYFIYLVFLMYQNMEKTKNTEKKLKNIEADGIYEGQVELMKKRLSYVSDIHNKTFEQYKNRLELFFKMF